MKNWISYLWVLGSLLSASLFAEKSPLAFQESQEDTAPFFAVVVYQEVEGKWRESVYWIDVTDETLEEFSDLVVRLSLDGRSYSLNPCLIAPASMKNKVPEIEEKLEDIYLSVSSFLKKPASFQGKPASLFSMPMMKGWGDDDVQPKTSAAKPFFDLPLSVEDKKNIRKLMTMMSDKNLVELFLEQSAVEKVGDKIRGVNSLRFMGCILSDPYLKRCLKTIAEDSIKWGYFIEGYEEGMKKEHKAGRLPAYLPGFAELLNVELKEVEKYTSRKDYAGLVKRFLAD